MTDKKQAEQLASRVDELRTAVAALSPQELASRSGAGFMLKDGIGGLRLSLLGRPMFVSFPDIQARDPQSGVPLPVMFQAMVLYYLHTADGTPLEARWVSFADLPDGRFYNQAFQGYTGKELVKLFGDDIGAFEKAAVKLSGLRLVYGDAGYSFQALPRVALAVVYHRGEEEFPASCQILFDAQTSHYLPTDVCAILASMLTRELLLA
ncbi:MAG: DUF3786 domain-containing protein [Chloroflexota bacterium]